MDKTSEYENIKLLITEDIAHASTLLQYLVNELYFPLLAEKNEKVAQATPEALLRTYVQISREIQKMLFDKISTHVLTIERLADHILCRRQAVARVKKMPAVPKPDAPKDMTDLVDKIAALAGTMSEEQIDEFVARLKGRG